MLSLERLHKINIENVERLELLEVKNNLLIGSSTVTIISALIIIKNIFRLDIPMNNSRPVRPAHCSSDVIAQFQNFTFVEGRQFLWNQPLFEPV